MNFTLLFMFLFVQDDFMSTFLILSTTFCPFSKFVVLGCCQISLLARKLSSSKNAFGAYSRWVWFRDNRNKTNYRQLGLPIVPLLKWNSGCVIFLSISHITFLFSLLPAALPDFSPFLSIFTSYLSPLRFSAFPFRCLSKGPFAAVA